MSKALERTEQRQRVYARDGGRCGLCGDLVSIEEMHLDHIIPRALGGSDSDENRQPTHPTCNRVASDKRRGRDLSPARFRRITSGESPSRSDLKRPPRDSLNVSADEMTTLRDVATALGYYTTRGPEAGRRGNVTELMRALAAAAQKNHAFTVATLAGLFQMAGGDD